MVDSRPLELAVEAVDNVSAHSIAQNWFVKENLSNNLAQMNRFRVDTIREVYCLRDTASRPDEIPEEDTVRHLGDEHSENWEDGRTWNREADRTRCFPQEGP